MKTAIIAVSKKAIEQAGKLKELYPPAQIYVPARFCCDQTFEHGLSVCGDRPDLHAGLNSQDSTNLDKSAPTKPLSPEWQGSAEHQSEGLPLNPLLLEEQEPTGHHQEGLPLNPLPLEGGGSGWGCRPESATSDATTPQGLTPLSGSFSEAVASLFESHRLLIFITATAVAVRAIAPCLKSKAKDPAVVVVDEQAKFAISLLSGHLGGANEETLKIARCLGAQPVITTATDNRGITAFDDLARRLGWQIENLPDLKYISAALLEEREILFYSDYPFTYPLKGSIKIAENPEQLKDASNGYVLVSSRAVPLSFLPGYPHVILRPPVIAAGVGCRRGIPAEAIIRAVENAFIEAGLSIASLACLASGEFKADEEGLIEAAKHFGVELKIFTREEISANLGDSQTSDFVQDQVGVGAVAEPCARLGSNGGELVLSTIRKNGITTALATTKP